MPIGQQNPIQEHQPFFFLSGRVYTVPNATGSSGTFAPNENLLYAWPFYVYEQTTFNAIGMNCTTQDIGQAVHLGIYYDNKGTPSALLLDAGTISLTGVAVKEIALTLTLQKGWYWLAFLGNSHIADYLGKSQTNTPTLFGFAAENSTTNLMGFVVAQAYGALPTTYTAGGVLTNVSFPVFLKVA